MYSRAFFSLLDAVPNMPLIKIKRFIFQSCFLGLDAVLIKQFRYCQLYVVTPKHIIHITYQSGQHILHKYISHKEGAP